MAPRRDGAFFISFKRQYFLLPLLLNNFVILRQIKVGKAALAYHLLIRRIKAVNALYQLIFTACHLPVHLDPIRLVQNIQIVVVTAVFEEKLHQAFTGINIDDFWHRLIYLPVEPQGVFTVGCGFEYRATLWQFLFLYAHTATFEEDIVLLLA